MGILAVHITTAKIRDVPVNEVALGHGVILGKSGLGGYAKMTPIWRQCEPMIICVI